MTDATAETASEAPPLPPGVIGYAVARVTGGRTSLTNCDLQGEDAAAREAGLWRRSLAGTGTRYVVCEVREVPS